MLSAEVQKAATVVVLAAMVAAAGLLLAVAPRAWRSANPLLIAFGIAPPLLTLVVLFWASRASGPKRVATALMLLSSGFALLSLEIVLALVQSGPPARAAAHRLGVDFDARSRLEVIQDLNAGGVPANADLNGRVVADGSAGGIPLTIEASGKDLVPLAAATSLTTVVSCNESGRWVLYESDELGYRNPTGLWGSGTMDIVTVGDSYTQGMCMEESLAPVTYLRRRHPRTINLGLAGAGPLLELAALKEHGPVLQPRVTFWIYFEGNDLDDLAAEMGNPMLRAYLEDDHRQGLAAVQDQVDRQVAGFLEAMALQDEEGRAWSVRASELAKSIVKLDRIRTLAGISGSVARAPPNTADLATVLEEASRTVSGWGGHLIFVYIPDYKRFASLGADEDYLGRREVLRLVQNLGLPVVDLVDLITREPDLRPLWIDPSAHFSEAGYRLMGEALVDALPPLASGSQGSSLDPRAEDAVPPRE